MHPILFEIPKIDLGSWTIGPIPIRLYGLMIGIGFLVALWLASRRAKKEGIDPDRILDMGVYLLLAAIVGSRLLYVRRCLVCRALSFSDPFLASKPSSSLRLAP